MEYICRSIRELLTHWVFWVGACFLAGALNFPQLIQLINAAKGLCG